VFLFREANPEMVLAKAEQFVEACEKGESAKFLKKQ
jgi:hypothetical protein